ncbi:MAG: hypothetical protein QM723_21755 [Myxococcaceae bacterium]
MLRRVVLATLVLMIAASAGWLAWRADQRDLSCLKKAERAEVFVFFDYPGRAPIRLKLDLAPDGSTVSRGLDAQVIAQPTAYEARQMLQHILEPLELPVDKGARPPRSELSISAVCDGGREHGRELISFEHAMPLRECWDSPYIDHIWEARASCVERWWKAPHAWSWRQHDDRAVEVGYRAWNLLLTLEDQRANAGLTRGSEPSGGDL